MVTSGPSSYSWKWLRAQSQKYWDKSQDLILDIVNGKTLNCIIIIINNSKFNAIYADFVSMMANI